MLRIGLFLPNLGLPLEEAVEKAAEIGVAGVQLWNVGGELDPDNMTSAFRSAFPRTLESRGLTISALCGHQDFVQADGVDERIGKFNRILELGAEWGAPVVTTESGKLAPGQAPEEGWKNVVRAFGAMARHAERTSAYAAVEPSGACLVSNVADALRLVEEVGSPNLRINLDPANLVMFGGDAVDGVNRLGALIVHTHAKDGMRRDGCHKETPVGEGDVPWPAYVRALAGVGFDGFLCLEREKGPDPVGDMRRGKEYLAQVLADFQ